MLNFYKNKKVFITGHTGFKGSWLCRILSLLGAEITGYALPAKYFPNLFELAEIEKCANTVYADVRDLKSLKEAVKFSKPDIIIHMAAQPLVRESYKNPVYTYETNVLGTVNVLEAARQCPSLKSFLNVTTDKVYKNIEIKKGYTETDELNGRDPYSNSKSCSELVTSSYKKSFFENLQTAISTARSGNVIGGGDFGSDRIIPDAIKSLQNKKELVLRNPLSVRPYQHVLEALYAYLLIIKKQYEDKQYEGAYNIGPEFSDCITTAELTDMFYSHFENAKWTAQKPALGKSALDNSSSDKSVSDKPEAGLLMLDISKIKKVLGWAPCINIKEAVSMTAEWTKAYLNDKDFNSVMDAQINRYFKEML
ncbi:MAG: CDP-glucose 4,6-dehydratase [Endomicrobium sp.]|jgi:CDP-glucose 4,6-dehydratase|nr:CDP-glucose 4,6-dehydratase [Endomicrobium sp.]